MIKKDLILNKLLILGIGNLLMGDEGVGIHVVRYMQNNYRIPNTDIVDGGTGGFYLLEYLHSYPTVFLVDATMDGKPPGVVNILRPKYSNDYPPTLTAHDIGLKDLLDSLYLMNKKPDIWLFTISISDVNSMSLNISTKIHEAIPNIAQFIMKQIDLINN